MIREVGVGIIIGAAVLFVVSARAGRGSLSVKIDPASPSRLVIAWGRA